MSDSTLPLVVCDFGDRSVSGRTGWETIAEVVRDHRSDGRHPFLVCSAPEGIPDQLESLCRQLESAECSAPDTILAAIRDRYWALAQDLGVDADAVLSEGFARLEKCANAIRASDCLTPCQQAAMLASGELLSTRLGVAYLLEEGVPTQWLDARKFLRPADDPHASPRCRYLQASCTSHSDPVLQSHLADAPDTVYLTQGSIASNALGETVLLGQEGAYTSAAHFAAKLGAERLEVWSELPGFFTANPREVSSARLLRRLDYDEAQELATMTGRMFHPRCLEPVRQHQIPLYIRSVEDQSLDGTVVAAADPNTGHEVKSILVRTSIATISMDTFGMWQEVGFLADVLQVFKHHGLSVDLVATSETNVTVTLDPEANALDADVLDRLLHDLNQYCDAELIQPCAIVSVVGRGIHSPVGELVPAFEMFDDQRVHLVTKAASDLNVSFVVDEEQAPRLVRELHGHFFGERVPDAVFGLSWRELTDAEETKAEVPSAWWADRRDELLRLADEQSPRYIYDTDTLGKRSQEVRTLDPVDQAFYAIKANPHPDVLRVLERQGFGFECVSPGELKQVFEVFPNLDPGRVLFQPNFAAISEYAGAFERGVHVTVDNVKPLAKHPDIFADEEIFVRVDPGQGYGHHRKVRTAGAQSKFGVVPDDLGRLRDAADRAGTTVVGLHAHVGSGVTEEHTWADLLDLLADKAADFPESQTINVGGGLAVPDRSGGRPLDLDTFEKALSDAVDRHPQYSLWMEPGRYLVAEAGVLLARVTQTKTKGTVRYVGLDTGMNSLLRPALYGAHHEIVNLTRLGKSPSLTADVVGPICESGDVLGHDRRLPPTEPGDTLLVATVGAYGSSMSNRYNLRPPASEHLLPSRV